MRIFSCRLPRLGAVLAAAIVLVFLALAALSSTTLPHNSFLVLYSGNRQSELEPCGCRPKQLGGIDKEVQYIRDVRKQGDPMLLVDSGGFIDFSLSENEKLKSKFLLSIMEQMNFQAVNVSEQDLRVGIDLLVSLEKQNKLPLVSANIIDNDSRSPIFDPYRIVKLPMQEGEKPLTIGIVGITYSAASAYRKVAPRVPRAVPTPAQEKLKPEFEGSFEGAPGWQLQFQYGPETEVFEPVTHRRVQANIMRPSLPQRPEHMTSNKRPYIVPTQETTYQLPPPLPGTQNTLYGREAVKVPGKPQGQTVARISRESPPAESEKSAPYEVLDPEETLNKLLPELKRKCDVVMVLSYLGLQGSKQLAQKVDGIDIIISGAPSTIQYYPLKESNTFLVQPGYNGRYIGKLTLDMNQNGHINNARGENIQIAEPLQPDPEIVKLIEEYKQETRKLQPPPRPVRPATTYASVSSCRACHEPQYVSWSTSRHAHAMNTLVSKNQQYNPDCLKCHTTGYMQDNGFRDLRSTPAMANVQCEVCHGAGYKHTIEQRIYELQKKRAATGTGTVSTFTARNTPKATVSPGLCLKCHNEDNDNDFNFERDVRLISHHPTAQASK
jgi:2',3'-cyclic-nucleotide 2'-phosphodiesterase (5'-nucleotidase family)